MNVDVYSSLLIAMGIMLSSAVISPLIAGKRKLAGIVNFTITSIAAAIVFYACYIVIFTGAESAATEISFGIIEIPFLIDSFSAVFLGIIAIMAVISAFFSIEYMEHYPDYKLWGYYLAYPLFIVGMLSLVTVDDLSVGFTVAWQLMTIASYFLIKFEFKKKENVRGANKYLILMELAWVLIIAGTFFIHNYHFGDSLHEIVEKLSETGSVSLYVMYGLLLTGFGFKAGVFPLGQLWLPDAHSIAPSPISALLSGVMLKTGIYGIMRTFLWMVPHSDAASNWMVWGIVIASIGVATLFIGTVQSMKQSDAKRLLAYSSIGQVGYIVFAIGAAVIMFQVNDIFLKMLSMIAIVGAMYHILNHAIFKGLLFLTSGSILYATGTKDLNKLGGLMKFMPITAIIAGIASLSIAGIPPFSGFSSKWTIISSSLLAGSQISALVIFGIIALFTSALTLACYVKFFGMSFASTGVEYTVKEPIKEVPATMIIPKVVLSIICLFQGLVPFLFYGFIIKVFSQSGGSILHSLFTDLQFDKAITLNAQGVSVRHALSFAPASAVSPIIILGVLVVAFLIAFLFKKMGGSKETTAATWLCGYQDLGNNNRYVDKNMFASLRSILWWTGGNSKNE